MKSGRSSDDISEWDDDRLGGGTQADSIMDRIIHNAYEIPTNETNLRKLYGSVVRNFRMAFKREIGAPKRDNIQVQK